MNQKVLKTLEYYKIIEKLTDYAASEPGKKLCRELEPSADFDEIVQAQTETADAVNRVRMKGNLSFAGVHDVRDSLKRLEIGSSLSIHELLSISSLLTCANRAKAYGRHAENTELPDDSLDGMFRALEPLTPINSEITRCIISEEEVADDASPGLRQVRRQMKVIADRVHTQLNSILNSSRSMLQDAVITMRDGRYCLPVKAEYRSQFNGMIHDQSSTGSTLFMEPMAIIKLNNEMRELEIKEQKEIEIILASLSLDLTPYIEQITTNYELLAKLDFIFAKAALAKHYNCSRPKFNKRGYINIKDGRHPLLDPKKVVPINVYLGKDFDLLIVTGPNTGGKTVSLKTVGLFTLMGQSGLQIPAFDGSELAVFDEVFADIGDEQSIEQSLSTFSAHMTNIVKILDKADSNSLCLFDELCAGTDPTEGAALAIAILSFLHNM
ncbi:MAG: endonuclease MutS2, partial [Lachnospiraceae bacterium]|nr:endonuclease MutS2 [Lachnospiraceae bacterium]